jgi:Cu/Ag efflux protein CusF
MQKYEFRDNDRTGIDASIFVPVDSSMMERNRACPERVCVIKAFDAEKREVTISFAELDEPEEDGYPAAVNYDAVEEETYTFRVTDDTMLSLIVDYQALVKPNRFFKYLEAFGWMYLYTDSDDPGVGFWIGIDGDTLLYLCEVYEE